MKDQSPHDLDAERAVLGAVLISRDLWDEAEAGLHAQPEAFFRVAHRDIWRAMINVRREKKALDLVTLKAQLERMSLLDEVGGYAYLSSLVDGIPRATNVKYYAGIVWELAVRRRLIKAARFIVDQAESADENADALLAAAEQALLDVSQDASASDLVPGDRLAVDVMGWLESTQERASQGKLPGVPSGLPELDAMTLGWQPGDLIVLAARPGQGKTAAALQFAIAVDRSVGWVPFFSLEMTRIQLSVRAVSNLANVDSWALRRGRLHAAEYGRLANALDTLAQSALAVDDGHVTVFDIRSKVRRWHAQYGVALVVVDYVQMVETTSDRSRQSTRAQDVATITRGLKAMAKELKLPVIALAQIDRRVDLSDRPPAMADLSESSELEKAADLVVFIHRPGGKTVKEEGPADFIVAKQRNGPTGTVQVWWQPTMTRFTSPPEHTREQPYQPAMGGVR